MPDCTGQVELFAPVGRCCVEVKFEGGDATNDAGVLLLRQVDRRLGLLRSVCLTPVISHRNRERYRHSVLPLLQQRV